MMFSWNSLDINVALFKSKKKKSACFVFLFLSARVIVKSQVAAGLYLPQPIGKWCPLFLFLQGGPTSLTVFSGLRQLTKKCSSLFFKNFGNTNVFPEEQDENFVIVQSLGLIQLFVTPWTAACHVYINFLWAILIYFLWVPSLSVMAVLNFPKLPFLIEKLTAIQSYKYSMW